MRSRLGSTVVLLIFTAACGAGGADGAGAPADHGAGGGGVSFGGAQDMGELRSILDRGELPAASSLDANGFFNEHFNETPPADCGQTLCLTPGLSVGRDWLTGTHQATLQIAVNTPVDPSTYVRKPMNLVVVVDHSGSMAQDERLEKVKVGLHTLVDNLKPEDRIALVQFDDSAQVIQSFTPTLDRASLHLRINALYPAGGTNIYDGLDTGFDLLGEFPANERQNRLIFLSDGQATVGITSQTEIMALARSRIGRGIGLTTVGVGNSFDVELMRGLAENGAGNYYFLEDATAASEVFTEELDYFMSPLALDVRIEASAGSGWTFSEVIGSRLWSAQTKSGQMQIPAVFLASRTTQQPGEGRRGGGSMIFVHLEPTADATSKIADLELTFRMPGSQTLTTQTVTLDYAGDPLETPADPHLSGPEMAERYGMYNLFLGLRLATRSYDPTCAAAALQSTQRNAIAWNERHPDPDVAADLMLIEHYLGNLRAHGAREVTETTLASCPQADAPYYPEYGGYADDTAGGMYCSSGKPTAGWLVTLGAVVLVVRRRRRT
jgi:Ca-activated chloride channel family protein